MKTVTFYSYKGGVGRSLALANVAADIALMGESLFLIDFDLEAPGLQTIDFLSGPVPRLQEELSKAVSSEQEIPGLTDLVMQYMRNPEAGLPDISDYVIEGSEIEALRERTGSRGRKYPLDAPGKVWFLPAGTKESFEQIDWHHLYENQEGYLFFEALMGKIQDAYAADWLFVDSRTGRAEIAGIGTRQMADINVLVFFPNQQNLVGFDEVYDMFVEEPSRIDADKEPLEFVYVASRVPTSDDEENILADQLQSFADVFHLDGTDNIIQLPHNNSLSLLSQDLFSVVRPKTALAKGYFQLTDQLLQMSESSLLGARQYFDSRIVPKWFSAYYQDGGSDEELDEILQRADFCANQFVTDRLLNDFLSNFFSLVGSAPAREKLTTQKIQNFKSRGVLHAAITYHLADSDEEPLHDVDFQRFVEFFFNASKIEKVKSVSALGLDFIFSSCNYDDASDLLVDFVKTRSGAEFAERLVSAIDLSAQEFVCDENSKKDEVKSLLNWYSLTGMEMWLDDFLGSDGLALWLENVENLNYFQNRIDELLDLKLDNQIATALESYKAEVIIPDEGLAKEELMIPSFKETSMKDFIEDFEDQDDLSEEGQRLVSRGRYEDASLIFENLPREGEAGIANAFNLAMSNFLLSGASEKQALAEMRPIFQRNEQKGWRGANFYQCFGVVLWASGEHEESSKKFKRAISEAVEESGDLFSVFDYRDVPNSRFVEQCFQAAGGQDLVEIFELPNIK